MLPAFVRDYALIALSGAPDVLDRLLAGVPAADPAWDARPDPARFTLREVVAHLADWDTVFADRIARARDQDDPALPDLSDMDRRVQERGYSSADPAAMRGLFRARRAALVEAVLGLDPAAWARPTHYAAGHPRAGEPIPIGAWVVQVMGHDGYHFAQIAEWLKPSGAGQA